MGQILIGEQAAPATPTAGVIIYSTVATPSILRLINDSGVDRPFALVTAGTWAPGIAFGGGVTGITYSTQVGSYERIGNRVFAVGVIVLSSKGSSTGVATITGLPIAAVSTSLLSQAVILRLDTMSSISGSLQGFVSPLGTTVRLEHLGTGTAAELTNTNFNNTSSVMVNVVYEV